MTIWTPLFFLFVMAFGYASEGLSTTAAQIAAHLLLSAFGALWLGVYMSHWLGLRRIK